LIVKQLWEVDKAVGDEFLFTWIQEFFRESKGLCQFCANLNYQ
jgi:hypothetical protein